MNCTGIKRRIGKLETASVLEAPVADQAREAVRHWRETGKLCFPDGSRISVEVYRHIIASARDEPDLAPRPE
jgi:hypothetical protein